MNFQQVMSSLSPEEQQELQVKITNETQAHEHALRFLCALGRIPTKGDIDDAFAAGNEFQRTAVVKVEQLFRDAARPKLVVS
jgi:hypothetical protein